MKCLKVIFCTGSIMSLVVFFVYLYRTSVISEVSIASAHEEKFSPYMHRRTSSKITKGPSLAKKVFVYLTQTESCLPKSLASPDAIGDPIKCNCDVIVLSWKTICTDTSLSHVFYLFNTSTTWTTGRNLLFRTLIERKRKYQYYTFLDDDVNLRFSEQSANKYSVSPWRAYEKSVMDFEPLVAAAWWKTPNIFRKVYSGECNYSTDTPLLPYHWFDALFSTFHRKVLHQLLPYYEKLDYKSVWFSQLYLVVKLDVMYPGQVLLHKDVIAKNPLHRPYARANFDSKVVASFMPDLKSEIPPKYLERVESKLQDWIDNVSSKKILDHQYTMICPRMPKRISPIPYKYVEKYEGELPCTSCVDIFNL